MARVYFLAVHASSPLPAFDLARAVGMIMKDVKIPRSVAGSLAGQPDGDCLRGDLRIHGGQVVALEPAEWGDAPRLVVPALAEAHCHLDKCHSAPRLPAIGGDLEAAITAQFEDKCHWTASDLHTRATRGIGEARSAGCSLIRSHVDWGDEPTPPLAWDVFGDLDTQGMTLQRAALISPQQMADPEFAADVGKILARDGGVLGLFVHGQPLMLEGLRGAFRQAIQHDLMLDFHVDETLGAADGLSHIARLAIETGYEGPILCGHACALMNVDERALDQLIEMLVKSNISICALPTTNLYLQGRNSGTPDRRGLTRLRELSAAGVPIIVASDNVADAFCPTGQHDPRAALHLALLAAHLDPPLDHWLPAITANARRGLGVEPVFVGGARLAELRICDVATTADLIAGRAPLQAIRAATHTD